MFIRGSAHKESRLILSEMKSAELGWVRGTPAGLWSTPVGEFSTPARLSGAPAGMFRTFGRLLGAAGGLQSIPEGVSGTPADL